MNPLPFFSKFPSGILSGHEKWLPRILNALGFSLVKNDDIYQLSPQSRKGRCRGYFIVDEENLDVKSAHDKPVPSIQAVASLAKYPWVILTNGNVWRLY